MFHTMPTTLVPETSQQKTIETFSMIVFHFFSRITFIYEQTLDGRSVEKKSCVSVSLSLSPTADWKLKTETVSRHSQKEGKPRTKKEDEENVCMILAYNAKAPIGDERGRAPHAHSPRWGLGPPLKLLDTRKYAKDFALEEPARRMPQVLSRKPNDVRRSTLGDRRLKRLCHRNLL